MENEFTATSIADTLLYILSIHLLMRSALLFQKDLGAGLGLGLGSGGDGVKAQA